MDHWHRYCEAAGYINQGLIRTGAPRISHLTRRQWMESLLPELGHPQRAFAAIHVAGTSGKGSVATIIAHVLHAAGVHTGLHVSPYLQVATEKLWVDGLYASAADFTDLVRWIRPLAEARRAPEVPLHGMASVALCLEHFRRQRVELGVIEAGVGGRNDLTNVLDTRVAVITALGLDHLKTLGPDLRSIAWHKAGIIRRGCRAVVLDGPAVLAAREQSLAVGARLRVLDRADFSGRCDEQGRTLLDYRGRQLRLENLPLGMMGPFQAENAALALAALEELELDPALDPEAVRIGLGRARLPGRLELIEQPGCLVVLDGAHNPDKLTAMLGGLQILRPRRRRLHLVYGALGSRSPDDELRRLAMMSDSMVITEPSVYQKTPRPAAELLQAVHDVGPADITVELHAPTAVAHALQRADDDDLVLVTGSLYLCGEARELFFPARRVVEQRVSWW